MRATANGLRGKCSYVSPADAKPGDLIFFEKTYNTVGASHVGIYALGVDEDAAETEVADRPRQPMNYAGRVAERTADDVRKPSVLAQLHAKQAERTAEPQKSQKRKSHNMEL